MNSFAKSVAAAAFGAVLCLAVSCGKEKTMRLVDPVDFSCVKITDAFWQPRLDSHSAVTMRVCIDQIENQTGRIRNFENAAKGEGKHSGIFFDDSDVYKAMEGMAYSLVNHPDPAIEAKLDEWTAKIAAAQQEDGYINTYYTLTGLQNRWTNMDYHEMYCAGHLLEAGVAYYKATGKRALLDVGQKMADYMMSVFGPGKRDWVPGHEEIELALVKLYGVTKDEKYLDFAHWLLEERGHGYGGRFQGDTLVPWKASYYQDQVPVSEMTDISGHAVRSMYLYCGMSDYAALRHDEGYLAALHRLWEDVAERNMYITGGIGQSASNEGFTTDYSLPNKEAYCETCASVGMVLWNSRMNQFTGDSKFTDVLERAMYNGALAGISLKGDRFFYVNPLESEGHHHRQAWYGCACCPSQICRFLPSVGGYVYGLSDDAIWVHLYIGSEARIPVGRKGVRLHQETRYPWDGAVSLRLDDAWKGALRLRVPGWCKHWSVSVNGTQVSVPVEKGYAVLGGRSCGKDGTLRGGWKAGDEIVLDMDMPVEVVAADPRVKEDEGKRAIQRGPVVYCLEAVDQEEGLSLDGALLNTATTYAHTFDPALLGGVEKIDAVVPGHPTLHYIPYYAWDNREAGPMKVWVDWVE